MSGVSCETTGLLSSGQSKGLYNQNKYDQRGFKQYFRTLYLETQQTTGTGNTKAVCLFECHTYFAGGYFCFVSVLCCFVVAPVFVVVLLLLLLFRFLFLCSFV